MNPIRYSDEKISNNEFMIALPSIMIGVSILSLPNELAKATSYSDGWVSIVLGGIIFTFFAVLATKVAASFSDKSFLDYTSLLLTRPVAIILVFINSSIGIFLSAYSVRSVAYISQQYLFDHTPMEVLALLFLLVIIYAVSGSRAGIFRINVLFLPIILITILLVGIFNAKYIDLPNLLPVFQTGIKGYLQGTKQVFELFIGFGIVLFYIVMIKDPANLAKKVVVGISIPVVFYMMIFLMSIAVFGNTVTSNLDYPIIALAKRVEIPGGIFERIEALFFTIWIMAIFNTVAIALDVSVFLLTSIFKQINKKILTFILSPIVYYIAMFPQQTDQVKKAGAIASQFISYFTCVIILILLLVAKIRGVNSVDKK